jgi:dipeptide/tripeptide permease
VPAHTGFAEAEMVISAVGLGVIASVTVLDVAGFCMAHVALEVRVHDTTSGVVGI